MKSTLVCLIAIFASTAILGCQDSDITDDGERIAEEFAALSTQGSEEASSTEQTAGEGSTTDARAPGAPGTPAVLSTPGTVGSTDASEQEPGVDGASAPSKNVSGREMSYAEAERLYRQGDYEGAVDGFSGYVARHPDVAWGHYMHALALNKTGRTEDATGAFEAALTLDPDHIASRLGLARAFITLRRHDAAETEVRHVLGLNPDHSEATRVLGRAHHVRGLAGPAEAAYRRAVALDPEDAWSMNNLGLVLIEQERFEEALYPLAEAVRLRPGEAVFQNNLGVALERTGHFADAAAAYEAAVATDRASTKASVSLSRVQEWIPGSKPFDLDLTADAFLASVAGADSSESLRSEATTVTEETSTN